MHKLGILFLCIVNVLTKLNSFIKISNDFLHPTLNMMQLNVQIITITQFLLSSKIIKNMRKVLLNDIVV